MSWLAEELLTQLSNDDAVRLVGDVGIQSRNLREPGARIVRLVMAL